MMYGKCNPTTCGNIPCSMCGFNVEEHKRRRKILAENGLTLCSDGLRRLIIRGGKTKGEKVADALSSIGITIDDIKSAMENQP